jgi:hypothetical protein
VSRTVASIRDGLRGLLASANTEAAANGVSADARPDGLDETRPRKVRSRSVALTRKGPRVAPADSRNWPTVVVESGTEPIIGHLLPFPGDAARTAAPARAPPQFLTA